MSMVSYIALGANLGDRLDALRRAADGLGALGRVAARSSVWETPPVGIVDQPPFLNAVVGLVTPLRPAALLREMLEIETRLGRERSPDTRWGPRRIDLDLLLHGDSVLDGALELPHPRMHERAFVLAPLLEIAPEVRHPLLGRSVRELSSELAFDGLVRVATLCPSPRSVGGLR